MSSNIGILGLGVMGKNLAWNIEDKRFCCKVKLIYKVMQKQ